MSDDGSQNEACEDGKDIKVVSCFNSHQSCDLLRFKLGYPQLEKLEIIYFDSPLFRDFVNCFIGHKGPPSLKTLLLYALAKFIPFLCNKSKLLISNIRKLDIVEWRAYFAGSILCNSLDAMNESKRPEPRELGLCASVLEFFDVHMNETFLMDSLENTKGIVSLSLELEGSNESLLMQMINAFTRSQIKNPPSLRFLKVLGQTETGTIQLGVTFASVLGELLKATASTLEEFKFCSIQFLPGSVQRIASGLLGSKGIKKCHFDGCQFSAAASELAGGFFTGGQLLKRICFERSGFSSEAFQNLMQGLQQLRSVEYLGLRTINALRTRREGDAVRDFLQNHSRLQYLDLHNCTFINEEAMASIAEGMAQNPTLSGLGLGECHLNAAGIKTPVDAMVIHGNTTSSKGPQRKPMLHLDLHCNLLGFRGTTEVVKMITMDPGYWGVRSLDLSDCGLDTDSIEVLISALIGNETVESLNVSSNKEIFPRGMEKLIRSIPELTGLKELKARSFFSFLLCICATLFCDLVAALEKSKKLVRVDVFTDSDCSCGQCYSLRYKVAFFTNRNKMLTLPPEEATATPGLWPFILANGPKWNKKALETDGEYWHNQSPALIYYLLTKCPEICMNANVSSRPAKRQLRKRRTKARYM